MSHSKKYLRQAEKALKQWCDRMSLRRTLNEMETALEKRARLAGLSLTEFKMIERWNTMLDGPGH